MNQTEFKDYASEVANLHDQIGRLMDGHNMATVAEVLIVLISQILEYEDQEVAEEFANHLQVMMIERILNIETPAPSEIN